MQVSTVIRDSFKR